LRRHLAIDPRGPARPSARSRSRRDPRTVIVHRDARSEPDPPGWVATVSTRRERQRQRVLESNGLR
jgi:hypothetical protein